MKTRTTARLHLGRIRYVNVLPFYHGLASLLEGSGVEAEWTQGSPAELNQRMRKGEIDLAPVSSLEYLHAQSEYLLIPEICIGSRDFSGSVLLFSHERMEGLNRATISLSEESVSAAALLKVLLKCKFGFENQFRTDPSRPEEMLRLAKACLVIGDDALFFRPKGFVHKIDLSEVWWEWIGLPFCFSVWAVRRKFYEEHPEEVKVFSRRLKANLERNLQDLERLLREGMGLTMTDERFPTVYGYLFNLSYGFDRAMREGLERFYRNAAELGLAPPARPLEFVPV